MSERLRFMITDYIEPDLDWEAERCRELGVDFSFHQMKNAESGALIEACGETDILLVNMARITAGVMAGLGNVKVIIRHGIGYDNLDVPAATCHGIVCANQPTASSVDVAEQAIMLMLAVYRKLGIQRDVLDASRRNRRWLFDPVKPVYRMDGKTLGIVGCGHIGSIVLGKMRSFGMNILVSDPYLTGERCDELGICHTPLDDLLAASDIVTLHVPVNEETRGMVDLPFLRIMKSSAVIVNTARGPIVNTADLRTALLTGVIAGAGIDVYDSEPPPDDYPLIGLDNAILTPHLSWYSEEGGWDIRRTIMADLEAIIAGFAPANVLNPKVLNAPNRRIDLRPATPA